MQSKLVGILNLTPDSFSDGGLFQAIEKALAHAQALAQAGATLVDVGAESTRPQATLLSAAEEWQRLCPFLKKVVETKNPIPLSIDTRHFETIEKLLAWRELPLKWINDVTGFEDPRSIELLAAHANIDLVAMHSLGVPPSKQRILPETTHPVDAVLAWGECTLEQLTRAGISSSRVILDPGIGFGKSASQSLMILKDASRLKSLGTRVLIGHSRKSFLSSFTEKPFSERDPETLAASLFLAEQGIDYLRVHDIELHARALAVWTQLR